MLSHTMLGTNDLPRATAFYADLLGLFGAKEMFKTDRAIAWGTKGPEFAVCKPHDGQPATAGNGTMVALTAASRAQVETAYARALALGATDEGAPGVRGENQNGFYGAYFRDHDGNKICIYRFGPPDAA